MAAIDPKKVNLSSPPSGRMQSPSVESATPDFDDQGMGNLPGVLSSSPTMGSLFAALGRRWVFALFVASLGAGAVGAALAYFVPGKYVSEVRLLFRRPPEYMGSGNESTFDDFIRSQAVLIRSGKVLGATIDDPIVSNLEMVRVHDGDRAWLNKGLTIKFVAGENILPIKVQADDPDEAVKFLETLAAKYLEALRSDRREQLARLKTIKEADDVALFRILEKLPPGDKNRADFNALVLIQKKADVRRAALDLEAAEAVVIAVDPKTVADVVDAEMKSDPDVTAITQTIRVKSQEIGEKAAVLKGGINHPSLAETRQEVERLQDELTALRIARHRAVEKSMLDRAKREHEQLLSRLRRFKQLAIDDEREMINEARKVDPNVDPAQRLNDAQRRVIEGIRDRNVGLIHRIEQDGNDIPWVQQLGTPTRPTSLDRSNQLKIAGAGGAAVFGFLLFAVAFREFRSRKATSSDEVTRGLGIPTVGTLPLLPAKVRKAALSAAAPRQANWESQLTEAVDALRTFLLRSLGEGPHVILVTSAVPGEGKTSLASQLAASMARAWRKTILIDGDLRKPAAHQLFDQPIDPGLSDVLRGDAEPSEVIKATSVGRLWLMPAGQWDPHAQQALAQDNVGKIFEQLKEEYDVIVVDSCPVLPVADTLQLGQHVDTVLLSVLKGTSRLTTLYAARERLAALEIPVMGAVFVGGSSSIGGLDIQYPRTTGS